MLYENYSYITKYLIYRLAVLLYCSLSVYDATELRLLAPEETKRETQRHKSTTTVSVLLVR